jgi:delta24-sterol reductase
MLTTTFMNDRDNDSVGTRVLTSASLPRGRPSLGDEVSWQDYSDRVVDMCEAVRTHDRDYKAMRTAVEALTSTPSEFHGLDKIVKVNHDTQTALVEANVTMETLVEATRPLHFIPSVVAESRITTVADAFATTTNSSSSSRFGTFDCTVMAAGVVLGNGHFASSSVNDADGGELLQGSAGACHSLGITTMLEISLVKAGPYVEVMYTPVSSISGMITGIVEAARQSAGLEASIDYVEGIMLNQCSGVIVTGRQVLFSHRPVTKALAKGNDFTEHVRSIGRRGITRREPIVELVLVEDYLFRHDNRRNAQQIQGKRFSWPAVKPTAKTATAGAARYLDFAVSTSHAQEIIESLTNIYCSWPMWICPVTPPRCFGRSQTFGLQPAADDLFLNVGIWGSLCAWDGTVDAYLRQRASFRYLHSRAPWSPAAIWFDHNDRRYASLRSRWNADSLASIAERLPISSPMECAEVSKRHSWGPTSFSRTQSTLHGVSVSP